MIVLIVCGAVWLGVRISSRWGVATGVADESRLVRDHDQRHDRRAGPQDAVTVPQDARPGLRASARADAARLNRDADVAPLPTCDLSYAAAAAVWRDVTHVLRERSVGCPGALRAVARHRGLRRGSGGAPDAVATFRTNVVATVARPDQGPRCLGGRDDAVYLRGWDDAVDWIGEGHDAQAPTWGDVSYMTGWNDAVRGIDRARLGSRNVQAS